MSDFIERSPRFPDTRWTLIDSIYRGQPDQAREGLEHLCQHYWYPIYAYLRRSGRNVEDAEDLTQQFFTSLVSNETLRDANKERGKLRTFLLAVLVRRVCDQDRFDGAQKRGGDSITFSIDAVDAENRYLCEPTEENDPEKVYLQTWARSVLETVREGLRADFEAEGRGELFEKLDAYISDEEDQTPYNELAIQLDSTPGAVRLLVCRLRKKFRARLRENVSQTVDSPAEIDAELDWLRSVLAGVSI